MRTQVRDIAVATAVELAETNDNTGSLGVCDELLYLKLKPLWLHDRASEALTSLFYE